MRDTLHFILLHFFVVHVYLSHRLSCYFHYSPLLSLLVLSKGGRCWKGEMYLESMKVYDMDGSVRGSRSCLGGYHILAAYLECGVWVGRRCLYPDVSCAYMHLAMI